MNRDENGKPVKQKPRKFWKGKRRIIDKTKVDKGIAAAQRLNRDGVPV